MTAAELRAIGFSCAPGTSGRYIEAGCALEVTFPGGATTVFVRGNDDSGAGVWMPRPAGSAGRGRPSCTDLVAAAEAAPPIAGRRLSSRPGRVVRLCVEDCGLAAADGDIYCDGCRSGVEAAR